MEACFTRASKEEVEGGVGGREDSLRGSAQRAFVTLIEGTGREGVGGLGAF